MGSLAGRTGLEAIFPSATGSHQDSHNVRRRLRKAADACCLSWVTPYVFRHSFATEMRNRGYDCSVISKMLGDRSEAFTRRVYVHVDAIPRSMISMPRAPQVIGACVCPRPPRIEDNGLMDDELWKEFVDDLLDAKRALADAWSILVGQMVLHWIPNRL